MNARVTSIRFPPQMRAEVVRAARGVVPILRDRRGFGGFQLLIDPEAGEGIITCLWETETDAEASESCPAYIGQMSMMSSFLLGPLSPRTYEVSVRA